MPWLMDKTMKQVNQLVLGRTILDSIIRDVVNQRIDNYEKLAEALRQVNILLSKIILSFFIIKKAIEGGVDMGTSTGDIAHGTERPESGPGELIVSTENNNNEGGETTTTALQNGTFIF
jgi:hypothetical protein